MEDKTNTEEELVRQLDSSSKKIPWATLIIVTLVVGVLGAGSGFLIARGTQNQLTTKTGVNKGSEITKGTSLGSNDTKTFKATAEGVLKEGGIDGEGQFHLERPGGKSQYVYLTSSAVDLSLLVGRKVKVWGETFAAEKAGWLMDVGRVEVLD